MFQRLKEIDAKNNKVKPNLKNFTNWKISNNKVPDDNLTPKNHRINEFRYEFLQTMNPSTFKSKSIGRTLPVKNKEELMKIRRENQRLFNNLNNVKSPLKKTMEPNSTTLNNSRILNSTRENRIKKPDPLVNLYLRNLKNGDSYINPKSIERLL